MRKFTLLTALFALFVTGAKADTRVIYRDNYADKNTSIANWHDNRSDAAIDFVATKDGRYMQFNLGLNGNNFNGTRFYSLWGTAPWTDITIPEDGYTFSTYFNFEQFGNNSSSKDKTGAYNQRNHEIAIVNTDEGAIDAYWGDAGAATSYPNYLFKLSQIKTGDAAGEGGYVGNGACGFTINNETDEVKISEAAWYKLTLNVVGQTVNYDIATIEGNSLKSGSYTLADGIDNRAGGILVYGARYYSKTNVGIDTKITIETDYPWANKPAVMLNEVKGNDRVYMASFADGETLHYILPGGEEQTLEYWDALDADENPGYALLTVTQSGTLQVWTAKGDDVTSEKVNIDVECGRIKLVDPILSIASVNVGYEKTYTVTFNNSDPSHLLPVEKYAIAYSIDGGASQEISNGSTITIDKQGTLVVTVSVVPVGGEEYYDRSTVTINNDVEYVEALKVEYINWDESHFNSNWTAGKLEDSNMSHWAGHWQEANRYDKEEQDKMKEDPSYTPVPTQNPVKVYRTDGSYDLPIYTLTNDEKGVNYATELLPLIPNTARANVAILLEEGLFVNGTSYNNLELTFDPQWKTDDAAKPNFIEIRKTNSYDRYDKGPGRHITDIVKTDAPSYNLYRLDTAIHSVRVFTYKGFVPTTGIEAVKTVAPAVSADAPIYNLSGVRVANANQKGIYIQNGKKFVVK